MNRLSTLSRSAETPFGLSWFNLLLIVALVLQLLILGFQVYRTTRQTAEVAPLVIDGFEAADVNQITITDDQGTQLVLARAGDGWVLPEKGDYPALTANVDDLLGKIVGLETRRLVTRTEASHKRLQVAEDDFVRRITLQTTDGQETVIYIGSSPNVGATNIRLAGQEDTYLTSDLTAWQANTGLSSWADLQYTNIPRTDVTAMTLRNANGELTFEKNADGEWTLPDLAAGEEFLPNNVVSMETTVTGLRMIEPLGTQEEGWFGLDNPQATVILTTNNENDGEQTHTIRVGAQDDQGRYVIHASDSEYYALVNDYTVDTLLNRGRADFLAKPDEGAATGEGGTGN